MSDEVQTLTAAQARFHIDALLNQARLAAIASITGLPATEQNLGLLANAIYSMVMRQVKAGLWTKLGVIELGQLGGLRVSASFGNGLMGEPPIVVKYDFSKTALPSVVSSSTYTTGAPS